MNPNISGRDSTASLGSTGSDVSSGSTPNSDKDMDLVIMDIDDIPRKKSGPSVVSLKVGDWVWRMVIIILIINSQNMYKSGYHYQHHRYIVSFLYISLLLHGLTS